MSKARQLRLGAFMRPVSIHTGAWRYPGAFPDANFNFAHLKRFAQTLERGEVRRLLHGRPPRRAEHADRGAEAQPHGDVVRAADPAVGAGRGHRAHRPGRHRLDHYNEPYHIARKFASLDHISGGRAGWNIVTTSNPERHSISAWRSTWSMASATRRAREFYDVVTGLWDSWADDAFIRDVESGIYFDPDKLHVLDHKGK